MDMKYIVYEGFLGCENIIIFSAINSHKEFAENLKLKVISAGFINKNFKCYGESITLNVKSRPQDTELLFY